MPEANVATFRSYSRLSGVRSAWRSFQRGLERPLTPYYLILGSSALILVLGLMMVFSASQIQARLDGLPFDYYFKKQLISIVIGAGLMYLGVRMPVRAHRALAYPLLLGVVVLLLAVMVPGIGVEVNGNRNWIRLGGFFQIQPSEFAKLALVLWAADLLTRKQQMKTLGEWKHLLIPLVPVGFLLLALVLAGGDMGTAMIICALLFGLLWMAGAPTRLFSASALLALLASAVLIITVPHRLSRLGCIGATHVGADGSCFQAVHGIWALASGGIFGTGIGASVQKWGQLPEPHTDFIFAVTGEELGLAGTVSVLVLFAALGYAGIRVAVRTKEPFIRYAAGGATTWIMAQAMINIGAVLGLLPIAGVPLPMFSYGGSALLPTMFAIGLLLCFARSEPRARATLAARSKRRSKGNKQARRRFLRRPHKER
ncbi:putative lipid II flippase FtsW [Streptacidiphilus neutrinimicus]|uniref:putative lipid II flippase FtsW n=1 Tax=Streptacidiphilus neutrinimicus TaxID=105420 RepID=UPI000A00B7C2|nr:putative lipid II flippase FtsW [Streptacidiphilus neutrinimicus]